MMLASTWPNYVGKCCSTVYFQDCKKRCFGVQSSLRNMEKQGSVIEKRQCLDKHYVDLLIALHNLEKAEE